MYSKGIIRAHGTHCCRFVRACLGAIRRALLAGQRCKQEGQKKKRGGGQNQKWPTCGQGGYITPAAWGVPTASKRGAESEVDHKWARWLPNPRRLGGPHRFRAGGRIRSGPQVGKVATNPCRLGGPHRFRAGGRIRSGSSQKWKILFFWGHATKCISQWGDNIKNSPQVGPVAAISGKTYFLGTSFT